MFVLFFFYQIYFKSAPPKADSIQPIPTNETFIEQEAPSEYEDIAVFVEVKGAVNKPGVYELSEGDRVLSAIELAGGYLAQSDTKSINHAQKVEDEMVIYVPLEGEVIEQIASISTPGNSNGGGLVNINKADASILTTLPGIGPAKADAIISFREENGPFKETADLMKVTGIGKKTYEKLEALLTAK